MSTAIIVSKLEAVEVAVSDEVRARVASVLEECREITEITNGMDAAIAVDAQRAASQLNKAIEANRLEVTRPLDALKDKILTTQRELTTPLSEEVARLSRLGAAFETKRRAEEAEKLRAAREEQARIEREAREKAEAERRRIADEARAAEEEARANGDDLGAAIAQQEAAEKAAEAERVAAVEAERAATAARERAIVAAPPPKPTGARLNVKPAYEITDLKAALAHRPEWFEIKPRDGVIKAALKTVPEGAEIPGIRHWRETSLSA